MSPKPDVSEERKKQILDAAIEVFSQDGFNNARMDDIAKHAEMSKGALYWYFESKDEIISNILMFFFNRELDQVRGWDTEKQTARETLEKYSELLIQDLSSMKAFITIIYEFVAMVSRNKHVKNVIQKSMKEYIDITVPVVQKGIDSGEFKDLDAYETTLAYGALIEGSILLWVYDMEGIDFEQMVSRNIQIFLDGIEK